MEWSRTGFSSGNDDASILEIESKKGLKMTFSVSLFDCLLACLSVCLVFLLIYFTNYSLLIWRRDHWVLRSVQFKSLLVTSLSSHTGCDPGPQFVGSDLKERPNLIILYTIQILKKITMTEKILICSFFLTFAIVILLSVRFTNNACYINDFEWVNDSYEMSCKTINTKLWKNWEICWH